MTFYSWLKKQKDREDRVGELAQKAADSNTAPKAQYASEYREWTEWVTRRRRTQKGANKAINILNHAFYEWMYDYKEQFLGNLDE